jgi:2-hydroxy-3-keto-5-methylthiopentenyl-1-phosphate phosphatase
MIFIRENEIDVNVLAGGMQTSIRLTFRKAINLVHPSNDDYEFIESVENYLRKVMKFFL